MFSGKMPYEFLSKEFTWFWALLAFQAGFANAGGFIAGASFVSHVTGIGTMVGISLSQLNYVRAIELLSVPLFFLLGAMFSAFSVDRPILNGKKPHYLLVMATMVGIFALVTLGGVLGWFGLFGDVNSLDRTYILLCMLSLACGMQNACFVSVTKGQIRTTHLTGILTDIGIVFVRLFLHEKGSRKSVIEGRSNRIRILTFFSFSFGSAASALLFQQFEYYAFGFLTLFSMTLFAVMAVKQARVSAEVSSQMDCTSRHVS